MGIDYTKRPASPEPTPEPAASTPTPPPPPPPSGSGPAAGAGAPVSLSKVTLTKSAPSVSLTKKGTSGGVLRVNLNWNARPAGAPAPASGGFFRKLAAGASGGSGGASIDLDLACLYQFSDGSSGVVQALGGGFTSRSTYPGGPICRLDGDDRSGTNSAGENLFVDLTDVSRIKRILVFAFIYEGVANWAAADGVVTLYPVSGPEVEVRLDETQNGKNMCAVAMLENVNGELVVRREVRYLSGHREIDKAFGWGLNWTAGRK